MDSSRAASCQQHFYPRSPCGERLLQTAATDKSDNFYPRSPCGERPSKNHQHSQSRKISIHALLAESDVFHQPFLRWLWYFYPRSPCGERLFGAQVKWADFKFLSTLSLRRATGRPQCAGRQDGNFYPRSPCGERRRCSQWQHLPCRFLSTLSLRRATSCPPARPFHCHDFYPRSPCGERRRLRCCFQTGPAISIHALLAESDFPCHCVPC